VTRAPVKSGKGSQKGGGGRAKEGKKGVLRRVRSLLGVYLLE